MADGQNEKAPPSNGGKEAKAASAERINKLIRQLGDKDYYVRQRAQDELARFGFEAFEALSAATTDDDLEISARAKYLLRLMRVEWTQPSDSPEVKKCLSEYESQDAGGRQQIMHALALLPRSAGVGALCRLVRFEKSMLLSKTAALVLLSPRTAGTPPSAMAIEVVRKNLLGCKRPGAVWLLAWTRLAAEPALVMSQWTKLVDDEQQAFRKNPNESSSQIITSLIRFQAAWLKKLGNTEAATAAIKRLVDQERGDSETLTELMAWLIDQKAWKSIDDLAKRFESQIGDDPALLYLLAEAYASQGMKDRAGKTADRARAMFPGKKEDSLLQHIRVAQQLRERGQFGWSRREYEYVIVQGGEKNSMSLFARNILADMLHDQGEDLDAAKTLDPLVKLIDKGRVSDDDLYGRKPDETRCRANYYYACHWAVKGDLLKQREYLDKAFKIDPTDVDVLIACYRLPNQPPEYRKMIVRQINKIAETLHAAIAKDADSPSPYNQYAWLVGNTEGDLDEALRCSLKSLELQPDEAAYLDTLGHVYFTRGDLANAVNTQAKAVELEPHSGIIRRELVRFRKVMEEKKASEKKPTP